MNRRVWIGVLAGLLAATVVLGVAGSAFRAGEHRAVVTRTTGDGEVVRVVDGPGWGWGYGPGPGFFLVPLLGIGLVVLLLRGRPGGYGGYGPGPWRHGGYEAAFREWHQKAHEENTTPADR